MNLRTADVAVGDFRAEVSATPSGPAPGSAPGKALGSAAAGSAAGAAGQPPVPGSGMEKDFRSLLERGVESGMGDGPAKKLDGSLAGSGKQERVERDKASQNRTKAPEAGGFSVSFTGLQGAAAPFVWMDGSASIPAMQTGAEAAGASGQAVSADAIKTASVAREGTPSGGSRLPDAKPASAGWSSIGAPTASKETPTIFPGGGGAGEPSNVAPESAEKPEPMTGGKASQPQIAYATAPASADPRFAERFSAQDGTRDSSGEALGPFDPGRVTEISGAAATGIHSAKANLEAATAVNSARATPLKLAGFHTDQVEGTATGNAAPPSGNSPGGQPGRLSGGSPDSLAGDSTARSEAAMSGNSPLPSAFEQVSTSASKAPVPPAAVPWNEAKNEAKKENRRGAAEGIQTNAAVAPSPANAIAGPGSTQVAAGATAHAGKALVADPFTAMDSAIASKSVDGAILHASQREVAAGVHDPAYGWVEVKTRLSGGQVSASLAAPEEARHALAAQLPALADYLAERRIAIDRIGLTAQPEASFSGGGCGSDAGGGQAGGGQAGSFSSGQGQAHSGGQRPDGVAGALAATPVAGRLESSAVAPAASSAASWNLLPGRVDIRV